MTAPRIDRPVLQINRNLMQFMVRDARQKVKIIEAGRGSGKSTVLADEMEDIAHDMPRSTNFLQGDTYQQILTRTLPSTIESLTTLGYVKDLHYFVNRRPPPSWKWDEPYEPPLNYKNTIYWYTGAVWVMLSQDVSSRGLNTASGMADEFCLLDPAKFQKEVLATLRAQKKRFKNNRRWLSQTYVSSIPRTQQGKHIYTFQEEALKHPDKIFYIRASSKVNTHNLPDDWFEIQRRSMTPYEYAIEILNIRPRAVNGGFYPLFNEKQHTYVNYNNAFLEGLIDEEKGYDPGAFKDMDCRQDGEILGLCPLEIALDYGKFSCVVTGQENGTDFNFLSSMSVISPKMTTDAVELWCDYYRFHPNKTVFYYYDQTAMGSDGRSPKCYSEIVIATLSARGWSVIPLYYGSAPSHKDKYVFWSIAMRNDHARLPRFFWNRINCKYLIESINNSEAREGSKGIEKIKLDERNDSIDQRFTTHQGDAMDMLAYYKYSQYLDDTAIFIPTRML